ncbi:Aldehyde dehydrogenase [Novipirellula aureliae]|uniref:Aldehyde dehydrogenase n=1 Tax=Novipirellula aureliae TaxID=2527966 RepID=A0A5C6E7A0_9BACT|nr:aldehyde dehydrogenase family protein [Novipirellula aureliae]TWU43346.1 Aldehyde dehydrogenase [Novipirellula aureliae]
MNQAWASFSAKQRCRAVSKTRHVIADRLDRLIDLSRTDQRCDAVETITAELFPFCEALKFIGKRGPKLLAPRHLGTSGRPVWLWGVRSTIRRDPHGKVLILGPWNYPLFLVGTQIAQALAAGNQVLVKPAEGCEKITAEMVDCFYTAGVPRLTIRLLDTSAQAAIDTIAAGVDLVVLTGSAATGRKVLAQTAQTITPTIMELSGCDASIVLPGADLERVAAAVDFGLNLNHGATCIGPRRWLIEDSSDTHSVVETLLRSLDQRLSNRQSIVHPSARETVARCIESAIRQGAVDRLKHFDANRLRRTGEMKPVILDHVDAGFEIAAEDLFAPVISVVRLRRIDDAVGIVNGCRYRLAASIFGPPGEAKQMADRLEVGCVTINDLITATADPRIPFGGRGESGFGVTRGGEGLLSMTTAVTISQRRGRFAPHLAPRTASDQARLGGALRLMHGSTLKQRLAAIKEIISSMTT